MEQPKQKPDAKEMLRRAAREVPMAALVGGLGYGITRTGLELYLQKHPNALPKLQAGALPVLAGMAASYSGYRLNKELKRRITEPR